MDHLPKRILCLVLTLYLLIPSPTKSSVPLRCLEYIYESNIQPGIDLFYILRNDELLDDRFYALAMSRGNILVGNLAEEYPSTDDLKSRVFQHGFNPVTHYVMVFDRTTQLQEQLQFLATYSPGYNSRMSFVVVFLDDARDCREQSVEIAECFELLWVRFRIHNALLVYCSEGIGSRECLVYIWSPYSRYSSCGANFYNYDQIDRCYIGDLGEFRAQYVNEKSVRYESEVPLKSLEILSIVTYQGISTAPPTPPPNPLKLPAPDCSSFVPNAAFFTEARIRSHNYSLPLRKSPYPSGTFELRSQRAHLPPPTPIYPEPEFLLRALSKHPSDFQPQQKLISINEPHFYHQVPDDLGGCEVRALVAIWPPMVTDPARTNWIGMEHKLMLDVARYANFRLVEHLVDVNCSGIEAMRKAIGEFKSHSADIFFGNLYPHFERHSEFDHSIGYLHDVIEWVVPRAGKQPLWRNLASAFR